MEHRTTHISTLAAVLFCLACPAFAAPDYSGEWGLDRSRSDLGPFGSVATLVRKIVHDEPRLTIEIEMDRGMGRQTGELRLLTQGEEISGTIAGEETNGTAFRLGDHLLVTTTRELDGLRMRIDELWTLAGDGMTLRVDAVVTTAKGREELVAIFVRQ